MKSSIFFLVFLLISSNSYPETVIFSVLNIRVGSNVKDKWVGLLSEGVDIKLGFGCPY